VVSEYLPPKVGKAIFYMQHVPCNACPGSFGHAIPVPEMENETGGSIPCDLFVVMARANQLKIV
jgi:hypothetical protein